MSTVWSAETRHGSIPLLDPHKHIRLLHIHAGQSEDDIECTLTTWVLRTAPEFYAISYTWGDPLSLAKVQVDGVPLVVRQNSKEALRQVRLHHPDSYVWMDAICINQDDLTEKGAQVSVMGEIYSKAAKVLVCIGAHDKSSQVLYNTLLQLTSANISAPFDQSHAQAWILRQPLQWRRDLLHHWNMFSRRSYFHRLWICQEVHEAKGNAIVLCGDSMFSWTAMLSLHGLVYYSQSPPRTVQNIDGTLNRLHEIVQNKHKLWDLIQLLSTSDLDCFDPRDRIYGTLRLIDWAASSENSENGIYPDYTKREEDISKTLMAYIRPKRRKLYTLQKLMAALRIDPSVPMLLSNPHDLRAPTTLYNFSVYAAWRIFQCERGELVSRMRRIDTKFAAQDTRSPSSMNEEVDLFSIDGVAKIFSDGVPCAVVRSCVRAGDIIVAEPSTNLVLRPKNNTTFEIVSQAVLINNFGFQGLWEQGGSCICTRNDGMHNNAEILLEIPLTHPDAMALAIPDKAGLQLRLESLRTDAGIGRHVRDVSAIGVDSLAGHLMKHIN